MASVRRRLPVWLHQVVGYLAGAVIIGFAVHAPSADGPLLLAGAALVVALAVLVGGVAYFWWQSRRGRQAGKV